MYIGKSVNRVDAYDKVRGKCRYTADICPEGTYIAKILHADTAHAKVLSIDVEEALQIDGVVKIITCFDIDKSLPKFATAGHPWSLDPGHRDIADRTLLTDYVRFYGDDIAVVIAKDNVSAAQALKKIKVEYDKYPVLTDVFEAMAEGAVQIHEAFPRNILAHTSIRKGNYQEAIKQEGLTVVDQWYEVPAVQHCHIENFICYSYTENQRIVVVTSTQIPHIVRRIVAQALNLPWGKIRIIKPYIGGGFGNKQDILYEPLCAYLTTVLDGHPVKIDCTREETFFANRTRHSIKQHIISHVDKNGKYVARKLELYSNQGAYASHGHSIGAKAMGCFPHLYPCENIEADAYTVFTNRPVAGAMRGYGIPQAMFAQESHSEDVARAIGMDPIKFRLQNLMPKGYYDPFSKNVNYYDTFSQCIAAAQTEMDKDDNDDACSLSSDNRMKFNNIKTGVGMAVLWYNTGVWPISLESSSCRLILNQDGSVNLQLSETEIGQGADTAFAQITADVVGINLDKVNVISCQDTDLSPFGTGAYASRQTYAASFAIHKTGKKFKEKIIKHASSMTDIAAELLDIKDSCIYRKDNNEILMNMEELATTALYSMSNSEHISSQETAQIKSNAYSFGCCFAKVEVDLDLCKIKIKKIINVHDVGNLINPALAHAQVHGGMSMGIGYALSEIQLCDRESGKILNDNFLDYKLQTMPDHPDLFSDFIINPEPTSPCGTKSLGEPPVCPVAPALRNAVLNACGVAINSLPLRPENLFRHFKDAGLLAKEEV